MLAQGWRLPSAVLQQTLGRHQTSASLELGAFGQAQGRKRGWGGCNRPVLKPLQFLACKLEGKQHVPPERILWDMRG